MRAFVRSISWLGLLFAGYIVGSLQGGLPPAISADPQEPPSGAVRDKLRDANKVLAETMQLLVDEKRYVPAIKGINAFAITVGGVDAVADLESGLGVDPETFAGLYADQASDEVREHLSRNGEGQVTYKNKVVRLYNATRLKQLFALRKEFSPVGADGSKRPAGKPKKESKETEAAAEKPKDE